MDQILVISFWNHTEYTPKNGIFIYEQVKALCEHRTDIVFFEVNILPSKNRLLKTEVKEFPFFKCKCIVLNIYSVSYKAIYINPWFTYFLAKRTLKKWMPAFKPALIHSNIIYPCGIVGHFLAKKYGCNHIISEHWSKVPKLLRNPIYRKTALNAYHGSNMVICVSDFLANTIKEATGINNTSIIPNIIDCNTFQYTPKINKSNSYYRFTCIANWKTPKRLDLIINSILAFSKKSKKNIVLNVVGSGQQRDAFYHIKNDYLLINWLGVLPKQSISTLFSETDIFLHASEIETFSIVTAEALTTGTPVLASKVGAIPELIHSTNGILVENTVDDWFNGLVEITNKNYDNALIAQNVLGKYSPEFIAASINEIYDRNMK